MNTVLLFIAVIVAVIVAILSFFECIRYSYTEKLFRKFGIDEKCDEFLESIKENDEYITKICTRPCYNEFWKMLEDFYSSEVKKMGHKFMISEDFLKYRKQIYERRLLSTLEQISRDCFLNDISKNSKGND